MQSSLTCDFLKQKCLLLGASLKTDQDYQRLDYVTPIAKMRKANLIVNESKFVSMNRNNFEINGCTPTLMYSKAFEKKSRNLYQRWPSFWAKMKPRIVHENGKCFYKLSVIKSYRYNFLFNKVF